MPSLPFAVDGGDTVATPDGGDAVATPDVGDAVATPDGGDAVVTSWRRIFRTWRRESRGRTPKNGWP